jgi:hypothetical protein
MFFGLIGEMGKERGSIFDECGDIGETLPADGWKILLDSSVS